MNLIPIDELVEAWVKAHKQTLADAEASPSKDDLLWWRKACQYLRPTPEDDVILDDEDEKRSDASTQDV